ncbi:exocyst complex component Sec10 [Guyanagaster necrorhizus]|uniref:Exocyst complex component Sec10 n=1 Tax=Guyanagaster necrorhizus TaxID=856835 RepID=A0A9P8AVD6_9AGAR|nr:exocyst complex component Sec10 [Guyanagaster necrorhizus MCA 3950]KAG7449001.1 exocyst complex component Sec10 [Guyanagaster necrorhizus MCA 3950]
MSIPSNLYLDPSVEEHLKPSVFKGKFDVTDFVGAVSEKLITQSKADSGPFDPKPFIRNFEAAVDKLIAVRKDVQAKTEQMEKSVRVSEREYSKEMADLNRGFEAVGNSFSGMEIRMNEVSSTAIRIGEQLESVHTERQRAQAAYDLIDFYNQFSRGDTTRLDAMRKEGRSGRRQVAVLLRRLNTVAKEVDLPTTDKTREAIEKYCEKFEKEMLNLFDRCYRKGDPKMMHAGDHCAQTLLEFNGGSSCVQVYVNQHDFFINNVRETKGADDVILWNTLPDPDSTPPKSDVGLTELFSEIRATVDTEAQIVKAVFPNPSVVMQVFLQRVFAQSIQQHMEQLLHRSNTMSDLSYLRILQLVHIQASNLVEDLKAYELPTVSPRPSYEATEFRRSFIGSTSSGPTGSATVSTMLETAMEELFVPYIEGQRYLERESRSLGALYASLLSNFTRYHVGIRTEKTQKGKSSVFDRVVNQLSAAAQTTSTNGVSTTSAQAASAILKFGGIDRSQDKAGDEPVHEEDGQLSTDVAEKMLKWHAEAIGRCVELSPSNDVAKNAFALLRVLAEAIGNAYVEAAIETELVRLEAADAKAEPSLQLLSTLRSADLICHLWQQYVNTALLPLASSSVTTRREMVVFNNQAVSRLEGGANQLTQRVIDAIIAWLSLQLTKQKKNDFKPRNDDLSFARVNTEPCVACCESLEKVRDAAKVNLSGKNLESFLTEIGVSFHSLLLEHLRRFPVSATGGLMLTKDIKMYQDTIGSFGISALTERFEFIRQLGSVFLVRPDILKSYITENYLGRIDPTLLKPYLALRSDWGQLEKGFDDEADTPAEDALTETKGLKDRFGRLSLMMKDLEGLKLEGIRENMPTMPTSITSSFSRFS